jgi:spore coat protein U-like protein
MRRIGQFRFLMALGFWMGGDLVLCSSAARAQTCSASIPGLSFGSVDVTANTAVDSSVTISVTCSGISLAPLVCVNIGQSDGLDTNASTRFMKSGANSLTYGLFSDSSRTQPVGSTSWAAGGGSPITIQFPLLGIGPHTETRTLYGRVYAGQQTIPAGNPYVSNFSSTAAFIKYGLLGQCALLTLSSPAPFAVTATVPTSCGVTTTNLNFGSLGVLNSNMDSSTTVSPVCTNGAAYNIGLDGGLSGATDPTQRKMRKASESITYGLYRDAARSQPFGNTIGVNTVSGTGSGLSQSVTVYGRIPPQATPSSGLYSDTIVVTLTF